LSNSDLSRRGQHRDSNASSAINNGQKSVGACNRDQAAHDRRTGAHPKNPAMVNPSKGGER